MLVEGGFFPIPVYIISATKPLDYDLYVQLNAKHILYIRKGQIIGADRLDKLRLRKVQHMWVSAPDQEAFKVQSDKQLAASFDPKSKLTAKERSIIIHGVIGAAVEALFRGPQGMGLYREVNTQAKRLTEFISRDKNALSIIYAMSNSEKSVVTHGINVAAIAVAMANLLELNEAKDLYMLATGCMLHDVGHFADPTSGFGKTNSSRSEKELTAFKEHSSIGVRFFQGLSHVDQHVLNIILEHEERIDGSGFPRGLTEMRMHSYPSIAATANIFDQLVSFEGETPINAAKRLVTENVGRLPLNHLNAIKEIAQSFG